MPSVSLPFLLAALAVAGTLRVTPPSVRPWVTLTATAALVAGFAPDAAGWLLGAAAIGLLTTSRGPAVRGAALVVVLAAAAWRVGPPAWTLGLAFVAARAWSAPSTAPLPWLADVLHPATLAGDDGGSALDAPEDGVAGAGGSDVAWGLYQHAVVIGVLAPCLAAPGTGTVLLAQGLAAGAVLTAWLDGTAALARGLRDLADPGGSRPAPPSAWLAPSPWALWTGAFARPAPHASPIAAAVAGIAFTALAVGGLDPRWAAWAAWQLVVLAVAAQVDVRLPGPLALLGTWVALLPGWLMTVDPTALTSVTSPTSGAERVVAADIFALTVAVVAPTVAAAAAREARWSAPWRLAGVTALVLAALSCLDPARVTVP